MEDILFVILIVVLLLFAPTCAFIYLRYSKSKMTEEEWTLSIAEQEERLKEAQQNHMY